MADGFLKCDECGSKVFTEFTVEECSQRGVMVRDMGEKAVELDYDFSADMEFGDSGAHKGLVCEGCGEEYVAECEGERLILVRRKFS